MSKPEFNKDGTIRKHGHTERQSFRLDKGLIKEAELLSKETGMPLSKLYREMITYALRDIKKDGTIIKKLKKASEENRIAIDSNNLIQFTQELQKMRISLNKLGNNLNQRIRYRYIRMSEIKKEEKTENENENKIKMEKADLIKKYEEKIDFEERKIKYFKDEASKKEVIKKIESLKKECSTRIMTIKNTSKPRDFYREKNDLVLDDEDDKRLLKMIHNSLNSISLIMEDLGNAIRQTNTQ